MEHDTCEDMEELKERIFHTWQSIADVTANLVASMSQRCAATIAAHGGHMKYRISSNKSPGVYLFQSAFCPAFIGSRRLLETRRLMIIVKGGAGRSHGDL